MSKVDVKDILRFGRPKSAHNSSTSTPELALDNNSNHSLVVSLLKHNIYKLYSLHPLYEPNEEILIEEYSFVR